MDSDLIKMNETAKEKPRKSPNLSLNLSDKAQAKITAAKARASRMFRERSSTDATDISNKSSGLCEETSQSVVQQLNSPSAFSSAELLKMLENQKKEIEEYIYTLHIEYNIKLVHILNCLNLLTDAGISYTRVNGRMGPTSKCTGGCQDITIKEDSKESSDQSGRPSSTECYSFIQLSW